MKNQLSITQLFLYGITILISLVVLMDFALPGTRYTEDVVSISKNKEKYYNAGGNSHNTYVVTTASQHFSASKEFAMAAADSNITYAVSFIFKEVNTHRLTASDKGYIYSFRVVSGLVLPLLVLLAVGISYSFKKDLGILLFVLKVLTVGNLMMLLL